MKYTEDQIQKGLYALSAFGGSPAPAHKALKDAFDLDIPAATLKTWRDSVHQERYAKLQIQHGNDIEEAMVRETRDIARAATAAMRESLEVVWERLSDNRHTIRAPEAAQIAAQMSKVQATAVDKLMVLTGRPQAITENRSAADIIRALAAKGVLELEAPSEPTQ